MAEAATAAAPRGRSRAAATITVLLVLGAIAAFVQTQLLKADRPPVRIADFEPVVTPGCGCETATVTLTLRLEDAQPVDAAIVDEEDRVVRTLASNALRGSGPSTLVWSGRDDSGQIVPDGEYRLRIDLAEPARTIVLPRAIEVRAER